VPLRIYSLSHCRVPLYSRKSSVRLFLCYITLIIQFDYFLKIISLKYCLGSLLATRWQIVKMCSRGSGWNPRRNSAEVGNEPFMTELQCPLRGNSRKVTMVGTVMRHRESLSFVATWLSCYYQCIVIETSEGEWTEKLRDLASDRCWCIFDAMRSVVCGL